MAIQNLADLLRLQQDLGYYSAGGGKTPFGTQIGQALTGVGQGLNTINQGIQAGQKTFLNALEAERAQTEQEKMKTEMSPTGPFLGVSTQEQADRNNRLAWASQQPVQGPPQVAPSTLDENGIPTGPRLIPPAQPESLPFDTSRENFRDQYGVNPDIPLWKFKDVATGIKALRQPSPDLMPVAALPEEARARALAAGFPADGMIDIKKFNAIKMTDPAATVPAMTPEKALGAGQVPGNTKIVDPSRAASREIYQDLRLRQEYINRPEVKDFILVNTQIKSMDALLQNTLKGNEKDQIALDQGLITMFNKLTDPQSVVRESEYARTPENVPMVNRIVGAIEKVQSGGAGLTNEDRKALVQGAIIIGRERGLVYNQRRNDYYGLAKNYGIDPQRIIGTTPEFKGNEYDSLGGQEKKKQSISGFMGTRVLNNVIYRKEKDGLWHPITK